MDADALNLLVPLAEGGEVIVVDCEDDHDALAAQAYCETKVDQVVVERRDGYIRFRYGGSLAFRSPKTSLSQQRMLHEAIHKALNGECVLVTARTQEEVEGLLSVARTGIPNSAIKDEFQLQYRITLKKGGELHFVTSDRAELMREGFTGEVYLIQESGDAWDRGVVRYKPEPLPRSRFERIDDDE